MSKGAVITIAIDMQGVHPTGVGVTYQRTINLGDYNSARYGADIYATLDEGADVQAALSALGALVKAQVRQEALPVLGQFRKQLAELIAPLPESQRRRFEPLLNETSLEIVLGLPLAFAGEAAEDESQEDTDADQES